MRHLEPFSVEQRAVEQPERAGGETAIDTQIEVDLICGGVGFDDETTDDEKWLKEIRNRRNPDKRQGGTGNVGN